jgi:pimeloyl-ACP methyl ester carboxylesterase
MASRKRRAGFILGALAAGAAAGVAAERVLVGRARNRPDPENSEGLGTLGGVPREAVVSFDGTRLHVEQVGEGPTIIFVHGYSLNLTTWHYQIRDLAKQYRLVLYDQRGHGETGQPATDDWSLEALARDLRAVIQATGGPVVLCGHSMGGMTVLKLCGLFPELLGGEVAGIVLVDTTSADLTGGLLPGRLRSLRAAAQAAQEAILPAISTLDPRGVDRLRRSATDLAWLAVRRMGFGPKASPAQVAFVEKVLADTPAETWLGLLPSLAGLDVSEVLPKIDIPALIVVGSHDRLTPPGAAERIAKGIKRAELVKISGAGHMAMLEAPLTFNARLRRFLRSLQAWSASGGGPTISRAAP